MTTSKTPSNRVSGITRSAEKKLVELYGLGFGKKAIAAKMTHSRFKTARGKDEWAPFVVLRYLKRLGVFEAERYASRDAMTAFRQRVTEDPITGCHLWTGAVDREGYGVFRGKRVHRFAYEELVGPLGGRVVHHICRRRNCVNPVHLVPVENSSEHHRLECLEREFIGYVQSDEFVAEIAGLEGDAVLAAWDKRC